MLMRALLGWLRGERGHCGMAISTLEEEDARRPSRERESLVGERCLQSAYRCRSTEQSLLCHDRIVVVLAFAAGLWWFHFDTRL